MDRIYTLKAAVEKLLGPPWTASSLRTEIGRGRLRVSRIAGKLAVTEADIVEMVARCREDLRPRDSTFGAVPGAGVIGSSSTTDASLAQAAARETVRKLKERSRDTSPRSTSRPKAKVISIRSLSRT